MIIDKTELFGEIRKEVEIDRMLAEEYNLVFVDLPPEGAEIIVDGRMIAFLPDIED